MRAFLSSSFAVLSSRFLSLSTLSAVALLGLMACGPIPITIPDGEYSADLKTSPGVTEDLKARWTGAKIKWERGAKKLTLTFDLDGSTPLSLDVETVDQKDWVSSCPTNTSSSLVEYLRIKTDGDIEIGGITYQKPILFGACKYEGPSGANPDHVYLAEESEAKKSDTVGLTCSPASKCVDFRTKIDCDPEKGPCTQ
jgi:hypothetical protein